MRMNKTKAKLLAGETAYGCIVGYNAPAVVEMVGAVGFDFVLIDCEHGPMNEETAEGMIRAAEAFDVTPLARVPLNSPNVILRFLDRGLLGIMAPHVNTVAEAELTARSCRYYPLGERGYITSGRNANWGVGVTAREFIEWANRETLVIAMIEDIAAVENLKDLVKVPGVDVFHVGPGDLAQSMGFPGARDVDAVIDIIVSEVTAAGKIAGLGGMSAGNIQRFVDYRKKGVRFLTVPPQDFFYLGAADFLKKMRSV